MISQISWNLGDSSSPAQRTGLVHFWLSIPADQAQALWSSGFGTVSKNLISELTPDFSFTPDQVSLRDSISSLLNERGLDHPSSVQLMLATFLLSPPGLFMINNADKYFPGWFVNEYRAIYVNIESPVAVNQSITSTSTDQDSSASELPTPDFGPCPSTLQDWSTSRVHLNRLLGLSNLYFIDPEDKEIASELLGVRRSLASSIDLCDESSLEEFWGSDLGDRYWSLVRSGIQNEPLSDDDISIKDKCVTLLNPSLGGGFGKPRAINAFLVSMMYFAPGQMKVDNPEQKIPSWLLHSYNSIFADAIAS